MITSKANAQLKNIRKLLDSTKARREQALFVVEGIKMVEELPPHLAEHVYASESFVKESGQGEAYYQQKYKAFDVVSDDVFKTISDTITPQGILAVVRKDDMKKEKLSLPADDGREIVLLLDDIKDPGNLGTIIRTAEAAGVSKVYMSLGCVDVYNPKVIRSTMGSIFRVPVAALLLPEKIKKLKNEGFRIYAAALDGAVFLNDAEFEKKTAVIIGNEACGISGEILSLADEKIKIPMSGKVESLNAAISAAVILYNIR